MIDSIINPLVGYKVKFYFDSEVIERAFDTTPNVNRAAKKAARPLRMLCWSTVTIVSAHATLTSIYVSCSFKLSSFIDRFTNDYPNHVFKLYGWQGTAV